jgi:CheY-like chemotaxis protein
MILDSLMKNTEISATAANDPHDINDLRRSKAAERHPRILLIDDDLIYCKVMGKIANQRGIDLTYCTSADAIGLVSIWNFDGAIIDFNLGAVTGFEVASYLETKEDSLPALIVSHSRKEELGELPESVQAFISKTAGPDQALDAVLKIIRSAA